MKYDRTLITEQYCAEPGCMFRAWRVVSGLCYSHEKGLLPRGAAVSTQQPAEGEEPAAEIEDAA